MARRTQRFPRLNDHQRAEMLSALARVRYAAVVCQMKLNPNCSDYLDLEKVIASANEVAGLWTGNPTYFSETAHSAGVGGKM